MNTKLTLTILLSVMAYSLPSHSGRFDQLVKSTRKSDGAFAPKELKSSLIANLYRYRIVTQDTTNLSWDEIFQTIRREMARNGGGGKSEVTSTKIRMIIEDSERFVTIGMQNPMDRLFKQDIDILLMPLETDTSFITTSVPGFSFAYRMLDDVSLKLANHARHMLANDPTIAVSVGKVFEFNIKGLTELVTKLPTAQRHIIEDLITPRLMYLQNKVQFAPSDFATHLRLFTHLAQNSDEAIKQISRETLEKMVLAAKERRQLTSLIMEADGLDDASADILSDIIEDVLK